MKHARAEIVIVAAFLLCAVVACRELPRYEWQPSKQYSDGLLRIDRWTGEVQYGLADLKWGRWVSIWELQADARAKAARSDQSTFAGDLDRALDLSGLERFSTTKITTAMLSAGSLLLWASGLACGWMARGASQTSRFSEADQTSKSDPLASKRPDVRTGAMKIRAALYGLRWTSAPVSAALPGPRPLTTGTPAPPYDSTATIAPPSSSARGVARIIVGVIAGIVALALIEAAAWNGLLPHALAVGLDRTLDEVFTVAFVGLLIYAGVWLYRSAANRPRK